MSENSGNADVLRPETWGQFIGQKQLKERLWTPIQAARSSQRMLDHVLLTGPKGFGKTSLARLIAREVGDHIEEHTMPLDRKDLVRVLIDFRTGVLFLDEIHALSPQRQEILLPVLETGMVRDGRRSFELPCLTLVAATTEPDKVIGTLYDRFPIIPDFVPYTDDELALIVAGMSAKAGIALDEETIRALGTASAGTPRTARRLVLAGRDLIETGQLANAQTILGLCGIEPDGLTATHLRHLRHMLDLGGVAGERTLAVLLRLPPNAMKELERPLVERQYIDYTPSGRKLLPLGYDRARGRKRGEEISR